MDLNEKTVDKAYLLSHITDEDHPIFERIEKLRCVLSENPHSVSFQDYGARSPTAGLSEEQMYEGQGTEKSICDLARTGLKNEWAHYLYMLIKANRPRTILELGTCCGFSSIYMAMAYPESHIHTLEGAKPVADLALSNLKIMGCENVTVHVGRFQDTLPELLRSIQPIDLAFIDGHHDQEATLSYDEQIRPYMDSHGIMLFDDISWSDGMKAAWQSIRKKPCTKVAEYEKLGGIIL